VEQDRKENGVVGRGELWPSTELTVGVEKGNRGERKSDPARLHNIHTDVTPYIAR
jgi:hypothetical protein